MIFSVFNEYYSYTIHVQFFVDPSLQGLWAYDGWNQLNYISEEVKNPGKNLPRAIVIAMILVTVLYLLTNFSYLSVMGVRGLLDAEAVGTSFAREVIVGLDRVIPIMVCTSVFGTCLISCFTAARLGI